MVIKIGETYPVTTLASRFGQGYGKVTTEMLIKEYLFGNFVVRFDNMNGVEDYEDVISEQEAIEMINWGQV